MALNIYMHSRNPYKTKKPSFKLFAEKYPFFASVVQNNEDGKMSPDFKQPKFLAALARALLLDGFGLDVEVPLDRLIPTIPLRLNYILWVEDILSAMKGHRSPPLIVDIGTGSCCIYPILGAKKNGWQFIGSEGDMRNFNHSLEVVEKNNLVSQIKLVRIENATMNPLKQVFDECSSMLGEGDHLHVDVVMANPPFYEDVADALGTESTRSMSRAPPKSSSSAARQESLTEGGEVGFARRLAEDSLLYRNQVGVFTIMLGKKRSVPSVRRIMQQLGITQTSVYEMCQGRVMRWGFAWTFLPDFQFPVSEFRKNRKFHKRPLLYVLPPSVSCLPKYSRKCLLQWVMHELQQLKMRVLLQKNKRFLGGHHLYAVAKEDTWTHARRRRREAMKQRQQQDPASAPDGPSVLNSQEEVEEEQEPNVLKRHFGATENGFDEEVAHKRRKVDAVCEGGTEWIEQIYRDFADDDSEVLFKANIHVQWQKRGLAGDSSDDAGNDGDDEDIFTDDEEPGKARQKMGVEADDEPDRLVLSIEWLGGPDREVANRILCYLKNKLK